MCVCVCVWGGLFSGEKVAKYTKLSETKFLCQNRVSHLTDIKQLFTRTVGSLEIKLLQTQKLLENNQLYFITEQHRLTDPT